MGSVSLQGVSKCYGRSPAVDHVDLEIAESEFVVLLGPSGCGKTTTLRMIAGFIRPSTGRILIGGKDVTNVPPRKRNIGMVFQNYALFPNMSVADNIGFGLRERRSGRAEIRRRVDELLELIQLSGAGQRYPSELSGGQQQRVALARALAYSPQLLLMDEPLSALDLKLRESMQLELHRLQQELGITTIFVTHDQQEAMTLSDRIAIILNGKVEQVGKPQELYFRPRTKFVADFIGKNNSLRGVVSDANSAVCSVDLRAGAKVTVNGCAAFGPGTAVELSIRPEDLRLVQKGETCAYGLAGQVQERRFLGNIEHYFLVLGSGEKILVERRATEDAIELGAEVFVTWSPEAAVVFPSARAGS